MKESILKRIISIILVGLICAQSVFAEGINVIDSMTNINTEQNLTTITVGEEQTGSDGEIIVPINISNNVGLTGLTLSVEYDDESLTLSSITRGTALSTLTFTKPGDMTLNPINLVWDGVDADTSNGNLVSFEFSILGNVQCTEDLIDITVVTACDEDLEDVEVIVNQGLLVDLEMENVDIINPSSPDVTINQIPNEMTDDEPVENLDSIHVNANIIYGNDYYEGLLRKEKILEIVLNVDNKRIEDEDLVAYFAQYNSDGNMISLISNDVTKNYTSYINSTFNSDTSLAKFFFWGKNSLKPIMNYITFSASHEDYYADNMLEAQEYDVIRTINGKINSTTDIDYIKFSVFSTGTHIIRISADMNITGELYNSEGEIIASSSIFNNDYYCVADLNFTGTYYLKVTGSDIGEYSIDFDIVQDGTNPAPAGEFVEITKNSIRYTENFDADSYLTTVKLYSLNTPVQIKKATKDGDKAIVEFNIDDLDSSYIMTVERCNYITSIYDIKTIQSSNTYNVSDKSYVSVPIHVTNATDLTDITFLVAFDEEDFSVYDVCERTYSISETGTGIIEDAEVDIKAINTDAVIFKSTKEISDSWDGNINTVKLQAIKNGNHTINTIAYTIRRR